MSRIKFLTASLPQTSSSYSLHLSNGYSILCAFQAKHPGAFILVLVPLSTVSAFLKYTQNLVTSHPLLCYHWMQATITFHILSISCCCSCLLQLKPAMSLRCSNPPVAPCLSNTKACKAHPASPLPFCLANHVPTVLASRLFLEHILQFLPQDFALAVPLTWNAFPGNGMCCSFTSFSSLLKCHLTERPFLIALCRITPCLCAPDSPCPSHQVLFFFIVLIPLAWCIWSSAYWQSFCVGCKLWEGRNHVSLERFLVYSGC